MNRRRASAIFLVLAACGGAGAPKPKDPDTMSGASRHEPDGPPPQPSADPSATASAAPSASVSAAPSASASAPPAPVEQNVPIVPLKIVATAKLGEIEKGQVVLELKADGTVVDKDGAAKGKLDGKSLTFSGMTDPIFVVEKDGTVTWAFAKGKKMRFDDKDTLVFEDGKKTAKLIIDDKGTITMLGKGTEVPPWRVDPMSPQARRAAALLSMSIARKKER